MNKEVYKKLKDVEKNNQAIIDRLKYGYKST